MDLQAAATANDAMWETRADAACEGRTALTAFRRECGASLIGTNVDAAKLRQFLAFEPPALVSTYEARSASGRGLPEQMYLDKPWGPRRRAFEEGVGAFRTAVYGTLDLPDCPGGDKYGQYRLAYAPSDQAVPVVLPHNSALAYGAGGTFDGDGLTADVASWRRRGEVAAVQHHAQVPQTPTSRWAQLVAEPRGEDFVEVVIPQGRRPLSEVAEVRVRQGWFRARIADAVYDALAEGADTVMMETEAKFAHDLSCGLIAGSPPLKEIP